MRTRSLSLSLAAFLALAACKKDEPEGGGATPSAGPAAGGGALAAAGPKEMTAEAFVADYLGTTDGLALMDRYRDGVVVSGTVQRTIEEMDGSTVVWLDAGGGKWVSLGFTDQGAAAKERGLKAGDSAKARCKVGGGMDNYVMVIDCELQ
jgi:hypothetical protein